MAWTLKSASAPRNNNRPAGEALMDGGPRKVSVATALVTDPARFVTTTV